MNEKGEKEREAAGYRLVLKGTCSVCIHSVVAENGQRECWRDDTFDVADNGTCNHFKREKFITPALPSPEERERQRQKVSTAARRGAKGIEEPE